MPQLDLLTFFPQFFWAFFLFICFYFYLSYFIVPNIAKILKARKLKLIKVAEEINSKKGNSVGILKEHDNLVFLTLKQTKGLINNFVDSGPRWVDLNKFKVNKSNLFTINKAFLGGKRHFSIAGGDDAVLLQVREYKNETNRLTRVLAHFEGVQAKVRPTRKDRHDAALWVKRLFIIRHICQRRAIARTKAENLIVKHSCEHDFAFFFWKKRLF